MPPEELLAEAEAKNNKNKAMRKRAIVNRRIDFRFHLENETNLSPNSVQSAMNDVNSFCSVVYFNDSEYEA